MHVFFCFYSMSTTTTRAPQRRRRSNSAAVVPTNYAGPIFNNAPEPSSLPIPHFLPPRPRTTSFHTIGEHKQHDQQQQFPPKMVTAHDQQDPSLMELQQRLSSMLKLV
ncbi:hypothetical protein BJV82DRAFT_599405 [Fennellomyces sp. T-0311]|nr:hypothetical protein BJV82DRAFT_599405 [Fennellomyces sp. T-0311]